MIKEYDLMTELIASFKNRVPYKKKIEISFKDALHSYLDGLDDDNRRIDVCNNIIKICRQYKKG